jgi:hexosaminidase
LDHSNLNMKINSILLLNAFLTLMTTSLLSQEVSILPVPAEIVWNKGSVILDTKSEINYDSCLLNSATWLNEYINQLYHFGIKVSKSAGEPNLKVTRIVLVFDPIVGEGGYTLVSAKNRITIKGSNSGVFYGIQTLIQLFPVDAGNEFRLSIPCLTINDYPRFAYRGMLLDVSRHFFSVDFIKRYIDLIALHKMNFLHLHLTDDQGWRIEIKKYPNLTGTGAWRDGTIIGLWPGTGNDSIRYGGFYTQEEIKDIVRYAQQRFVTIIPEIEMPGHSLAALASYPQLGCTGGPYKVKESWGISDEVFCAGNEETYIFLQDVLDEVMALFPSDYIHIGGDESPKIRWKNCPKCQLVMKKENLKDESELQSYFTRRLENYITSKGKKMIGWDEILEGGLAPNATVMSWRGESGGMAAAGQAHNVIMTPASYCYFDYREKEKEDSITAGWSDMILSLKSVYDYEPLPKDLDPSLSKYILGAQANVWTEYISNSKKVEYMVLPRMTALSEVLWSPKGKRNWEDFNNRMKLQYLRYDLWNYKYNKE